MTIYICLLACELQPQRDGARALSTVCDPGIHAKWRWAVVVYIPGCPNPAVVAWGNSVPQGGTSLCVEAVKPKCATARIFVRPSKVWPLSMIYVLVQATCSLPLRLNQPSFASSSHSSHPRIFLSENAVLNVTIIGVKQRLPGEFHFVVKVGTLTLLGDCSNSFSFF